MSILFCLQSSGAKICWRGRDARRIVFVDRGGLWGCLFDSISSTGKIRCVNFTVINQFQEIKKYR